VGSPGDTGTIEESSVHKALQRRAASIAVVMTISLAALAVRADPPPPVVNSGSDRAVLTTEQKQAETNAAKLMLRARHARQTGELHEALRNYDLVVQLLETAYGPTHERLVEPLQAIVATAREQYANELAWRHRFTPALLKPATEAQQRIVQIYDGRDDLDPTRRVAALVDLGDCYLYVKDDAAGLASYAQAWALQARLNTAESADAMFADPALVGFFVPENPSGHDIWTITVNYAVSAAGRVDVQDVQGDASGAVKRAMRQSFERTRARPRMVGGKPVAAAGMSISYEYDSDGRIGLAH
jgi:hypothetical protein